MAFASNMPITSSNVSTKSTSLRMVRRLASSCLACLLYTSALLELNEVDIAEFLGLLNGEEDVYKGQGISCAAGTVSPAASAARHTPPARPRR